MLAVALEDFSIAIIDIDTRIIVRKFEGHSAQLTDATFSPDSRWLITSAMDCLVRTWDIPSAQLIDQFRTESACVSLNMSPTGELLATAHVEFLGIFLWCNRTLYSHTTLKSIDIQDEPPAVTLPEISNYEDVIKLDEEESEEPIFKSPEQIGSELITLSGLASSKWLNLLEINIIRQKNKPKEPPKAPKAAPFFLPTIPSLSLQFDVENENKEEGSTKLLFPQSLSNLSTFGKMLNETGNTNDFTKTIEGLKGMGPSSIEFEIKSLSPDVGGTVGVMLQFLKCIEFMLKTNQNFELAQAYLGVFLRNHSKVIASDKKLKNYLANIQTCHYMSWNRIQEKLFYNLCVINSLKTL